MKKYAATLSEARKVQQEQWKNHYSPEAIHIYKHRAQSGKYSKGKRRYFIGTYFEYLNH
jgi:hypothetical protein